MPGIGRFLCAKLMAVLVVTRMRSGNIAVTAKSVEFWENRAFRACRLCKAGGIVLTTALHEIAGNGVSAALAKLHAK